MFKKAIVLAFATMAIGAGPAAAVTTDPPAGTCSSEDGCGCGGVYVLKFKFILAHC